MFEKLLSLLPYNPSLTHQLAFYSKRMREEAAIRRIGLVFIVLAFLVQFFAVLNPPQPTIANSTSDLINGGFTLKSQAVADCKANLNHYQTILANYGVTCNDVANATSQSIKSTAYNNQLYTLGWNPDGPYNYRTHKPTNEVPATLMGISRPLYWHLVSNQDRNAYSTYTVLKLTSSSTHRLFYILYHCGNLVSIGVPPAIGPCQYNASLLADNSACRPAPCPLDRSIYINSTACKACPVNTSILKSDARCVVCPNHRYPTVSASSPLCKPVCPYNNAFDVGDSACKPCTASTNSADALACVVVSKTATDPTQNFPDANNKTAQPGDTIIYNLNAKNGGQAVVKAFVMQENLSDVLDYATVVDLNGATIEPATGEVTWPAVDIKPGDTYSHTITVKVKDPIPDTPVSISDGSHFDLIMTNVYGNTININVPASPVKIIEAVTTSTPTLVNTGPGTSLFIAASIVIVAGYFFARARLLAKESYIAIHETAGA